jgi:uncharacterized protein YidB (DUF937 family)
MGLLDDVLGMAGIGNANTAQANQHAGALSMILEYVNSPQVGGIAGLQRMFEEKGLGGIVASWISTGQNLPISADQLQNVLHGGALENMAAKSGIDTSQLTTIFSQLMPHAVDQMTPNGQIPDSSALDQMMKGLAAGQSS